MWRIFRMQTTTFFILETERRLEGSFWSVSPMRGVSSALLYQRRIVGRGSEATCYGCASATAPPLVPICICVWLMAIRRAGFMAGWAFSRS